MKHQIYIIFFSICLFLGGCQPSVTQTSSQVPATETNVVSTSTPIVKRQTITPSPTAGPKIIFQGSLDCTSGDETIHCIDNNIHIEFEYPLRWGGISALLRTGWDSGYIYHYDFIDGDILIDELPQTGGISLDFGEGRDWSPLDFGGFGNEKYQVNSCEENDLYPICYEIKTVLPFLTGKPFLTTKYTKITKEKRLQTDAFSPLCTSCPSCLGSFPLITGEPLRPMWHG